VQDEILVVGGKQEACVTLQTALATAGVTGRVRHLKGKDQAVALFKGEGIYADRQAFPLPGLVFLDLRENAAEGFEVLWSMRRVPETARVPAIVITGSSLSTDVEWAYARGANSFVAGGYSADEFIRAVHDAVKYWAGWLLPVVSGKLTA
jgi:CheY-like chemotaxis protein